MEPAQQLTHSLTHSHHPLTQLSHSLSLSLTQSLTYAIQDKRSVPKSLVEISCRHPDGVTLLDVVIRTRLKELAGDALAKGNKHEPRCALLLTNFGPKMVCSIINRNFNTVHFNTGTPYYFP